MSAPRPPRTVLSVEHLDFSWPQGTPLFSDLNLALAAGVAAVVGDDGCGKTSLLRLLAGELTPRRGRITLDGDPLPPPPSPAVFWVDPQTQAHDAISAAAYLDSVFQRYPNGSPPDLGPLIEGFGLQQHLVKPLYMLSTGSRRKVWLSAALAAGAPLTLIDQPFAALDAPSIRFLTEQLHAASQDHSRVWLLADHAPPDGVALAGIIEL